MDLILQYTPGTNAYPSMLKSALLTLFMCTAVLSATAQQPGDPSSEALQRCLLATGTNVWKQLDLSPDQLARVRMVQEACKDECKVAGTDQQPNPISNADGSTIMTELDNILNPDQYRAWVQHCTRGTTDGVLPE